MRERERERERENLTMGGAILIITHKSKSHKTILQKNP